MLGRAPRIDYPVRAASASIALVPSDEVDVRRALSRATPPITVLGGMRRVAGYANDIWYFASTAGHMVAKARNIPEEDPEQIKTYVYSVQLLNSQGFDTPRLVMCEPSCGEVGGRQLSVLEYVAGAPADEAIATVADRARVR
jgi:hypothetical protein